MQIVNLRLVVAGATARPVLTSTPQATSPLKPERMITVWLDGASREVALYHREILQPGHRFAGPAVVAQDDTTICIPAGFDGHVDAALNLHLSLQTDA